MTTRADASRAGTARDVRLTWTSVGTTRVSEASARTTCHDTYVTVRLDGEVPHVDRRSMSAMPILVNMEENVMMGSVPINVSVNLASRARTVRLTLMIVSTLLARMEGPVLTESTISFASVSLHLMGKPVKEKWILVTRTPAPMGPPVHLMVTTESSPAPVLLAIKDPDVRLILMNVPPPDPAEMELHVSTPMEATRVNVRLDTRAEIVF